MIRSQKLITLAGLERLLVFLLVCLPISIQQTVSAIDGQQEDSGKATARHFQFHYGATVNGQKPGADAKVWFPIPVGDQFQKVEMASSQIPGVLHVNADHQYGNRIGYFETRVPENGRLSFFIRYKITRFEARQIRSDINDAVRQRFLEQDRLVPISGKPLELIEDHVLDKKPIRAGRQLYDIVEQYMTYDKTVPGYGNGDVLWACSSKTGNCTDFHSLFISLARSQGLPAKFEIGFPLPTDKSEGSIKGYHCWAWFYDLETGWIPVDISEADKHPELKQYYFGKLTPDRVALTTGRDIELFPPSASPQLNFFVYPHVEVGGNPVDTSQLEFDFSFTDIPPKEKTAVAD